MSLSVWKHGEDTSADVEEGVEEGVKKGYSPKYAGPGLEER